MHLDTDCLGEGSSRFDVNSRQISQEAAVMKLDLTNAIYNDDDAARDHLEEQL